MPLLVSISLQIAHRVLSSRSDSSRIVSVLALWPYIKPLHRFWPQRPHRTRSSENTDRQQLCSLACPPIVCACTVVASTPCAHSLLLRQHVAAALRPLATRWSQAEHCTASELVIYILWFTEIISVLSLWCVHQIASSFAVELTASMQQKQQMKPCWGPPLRLPRLLAFRGGHCFLVMSLDPNVWISLEPTLGASS